MKTKILTTFFLFSFFLSNAQNYEYIPLVNEGKIWSYCNVVKVESDSYDLKYSQFEFKGDTTVNSAIYKKLYMHNCISGVLSYMASMREENQQVYAVYSGNQQEQLIYNFSLVVGDSIRSPYNNDTHYFKVTKIDTIEVGTGKRKRIKLDFDTWIEGIGTLDRFVMYPLHGLSLYELGVRINYQKQGAEIIYKTNEWYFNENECNISLIKQTEINKMVVYLITPELLRVETKLSDSNCTFELLDLHGKLLVQKNIDIKDNTVNVGQLSNGLYIFRLSQNREESLIGKIMKQK